jgi:hypothetical protein
VRVRIGRAQGDMYGARRLHLTLFDPRRAFRGTPLGVHPNTNKDHQTGGGEKLACWPAGTWVKSVKSVIPHPTPLILTPFPVHPLTAVVGDKRKAVRKGKGDHLLHRLHLFCH